MYRLNFSKKLLITFYFLTIKNKKNTQPTLPSGWSTTPMAVRLAIYGLGNGETTAEVFKSVGIAIQFHFLLFRNNYFISWWNSEILISHVKLGPKVYLKHHIKFHKRTNLETASNRMLPQKLEKCPLSWRCRFLLILYSYITLSYFLSYHYGFIPIKKSIEEVETYTAEKMDYI